MKLESAKNMCLPNAEVVMKRAQAKDHFLGAQLYLAMRILCSEDALDYYQKKSGMMAFEGDLIGYGDLRVPARVLNPWALFGLAKIKRLDYQPKPAKGREKTLVVDSFQAEEYRTAILCVLDQLAESGIAWCEVLELINHSGHNGKCVLTSPEWAELGDLYNQVYRRTDLPIADRMVRVVFEFERSLPEDQSLYVRTDLIRELVQGLGGTYISDRRADIPKAEVVALPQLELTYSYLRNRVLASIGVVRQGKGKHAFSPGSETDASPRGDRKILVKILWDYYE